MAAGEVAQRASDLEPEGVERRERDPGGLGHGQGRGTGRTGLRLSSSRPAHNEHPVGRWSRRSRPDNTERVTGLEPPERTGLVLRSPARRREGRLLGPRGARPSLSSPYGQSPVSSPEYVHVPY